VVLLASDDAMWLTGERTSASGGVLNNKKRERGLFKREVGIHE
jgi:hypothetical protein